MDWLWLIIGLLVGGAAAGGLTWLLWHRRASAPTSACRWSNVLIPMLVSEGLKLDLPLAAINAALELSSGRVTFYTFIEVARAQSLSAPLVAETEVSLRLMDAAEEAARQHGRTIESGIQRVRDYGYGVVEAVRQLGANAIVLEVAAIPHHPEQRGELGTSVRQPNPSVLTMLVHDRTSCDVLIVAGRLLSLWQHSPNTAKQGVHWHALAQLEPG